MNNSYEILISKINEFTRKFYLNKLLRGTIYTLATLLSTFLLLFVLTYCFNPGIIVKTILFYAYLLFFILSFTGGIIKPALAYFRIIKNMSPKESALLIGAHFSEIRDKLLNTLQLKELADLSSHQNELILAGIDQKINELKPIPFSNAIHLQDNRKYIKYLLIPLLIIIVIGLVAPVVLKQGTSSFVQYDKEILPAAPFTFELLNKKLLVAQGDSLRLELQLKGDEFPQDIYIIEGKNTFKFEKDNTGTFHYTFKNLQKDKRFFFSGGGFSSAAYQIRVKPRPAILTISATLVYPSYLNKNKERIQNSGDLLIPAGTTVTWEIKTENSDQLVFKLGNTSRKLSIEDNNAIFKSRLLSGTTYGIMPVNKFAGARDSIQHKIEVIADLHPEISVTEKADSLSSKALYFTGNIKDDHGFKDLKFVYQVTEPGAQTKRTSTTLAIKKMQTEESFFYFWDLKKLALKPGQQLTYFFEVADNDEVNGYKITRSPVRTYAVPNPQQVAKQLDNNSSSLKKKMENAIKLAAAVEKESKKLGENLLNKQSLSFEDKKEIAALLDKQKKLEAAVQDIKNTKEKNSFQQNEENQVKEELAEKQKQIDDLFNNVLDPKTKALLEKLQALMDQNRKDDTRDELSKMNMDNKSLKKELDRILELYKQLEFEQGLQNKIDRLAALAAEQKKLAEKSGNKKSAQQELKKEQQQLASDFSELKKELDQLDQKNQQLEKPNAFENPDKESKEIQQQQQESIQQLDKNESQKAAAPQKKAAAQMQQLAEKLTASQQQSAEMENNVNAESLRILLQNLLHSSFEQEKIMLNLKKISNNDPSYLSSVQTQRIIKDNMKTIADSLSSLSKRVPQIESTVNEEMQKINFNVDKSLDNLGERRTSEALKNQQYTMTSINNLSLMLNEALEQLEKNQKNAKQGGKGNKKQSMQQLQQMQQKLNKNMQQAKDLLQKEGNKGSVPKGKQSEEFAKMAQQQQLIREALQKINSSDNKDGKGSLGNLNQLIKEMKATESDLVNKRIEQETLNRQKAILNKLLEADNADREQNEDQKRESKTGRDLPPSYRKMLEEFKKKQVNELELIQKLPPDLNYYYKNKISDYFKLLNLH